MLSTNLKRQATIDKEDPPILQGLRKFGFARLDFCQGLRVGEAPLLRLSKSIWFSACL